MSFQDITALLLKMKPSSSPTHVLATKLLKTVFNSIGPSIVNLINLSLSAGVVPSFFKHAVVEPALKKPNLDPSQAKNYRPVSKLPFLSKILEKIAAEELTMFLKVNNVLDKFQSGFHRNHSTETALIRVSSDIMMAADSGEYTLLVLLDLSSAFHTVDHSVMMNRLKELGLSGSVLKWFDSYLTERSFNVFINQIFSETTHLT